MFALNRKWLETDRKTPTVGARWKKIARNRSETLISARANIPDWYVFVFAYLYRDDNAKRRSVVRTGKKKTNKTRWIIVERLTQFLEHNCRSAIFLHAPYMCVVVVVTISAELDRLDLARSPPDKSPCPSRTSRCRAKKKPTPADIRIARGFSLLWKQNGVFFFLLFLAPKRWKNDELRALAQQRYFQLDFSSNIIIVRRVSDCSSFPGFRVKYFNSLCNCTLETRNRNVPVKTPRIFLGQTRPIIVNNNNNLYS